MASGHELLSMHPAALMRISGFEIIFVGWIIHPCADMQMADKRSAIFCKNKKPGYGNRAVDLLLLLYPGTAVVYLGPLLAQSIHLFVLNLCAAPRAGLDGNAFIWSKSKIANFPQQGHL